MEEVSGKIVKASFNLPKDELEGLKQIAASKNITVTHALRQAIQHEKFLLDEVAQGSKVLLENEAGRLSQVVLDPGSRPSTR